jgi:hypothetical protein
MSKKFATSLEGGPHHQFSKLVGEWEGTTRVWFEPGKIGDESPVKGTMRQILGGRFIMHEYVGSMGGEPLEGIAIYGYHLALGKYQAAWIDSFHNGTAIMFCDGKRGDDRMSVLGSYSYITPEKEHLWGWRTEIELMNGNEVKITAYNIPPEGEGDEAIATETLYKRLK